jgi:hypothetical protein
LPSVFASAGESLIPLTGSLLDACPTSNNLLAAFSGSADAFGAFTGSWDLLTASAGSRDLLGSSAIAMSITSIALLLCGSGDKVPAQEKSAGHTIDSKRITINLDDMS